MEKRFFLLLITLLLSSSAFARNEQMDKLASEIFATLSQRKPQEPAVIETIQESVPQTEEQTIPESQENDDEEDQGINKLALEIMAALKNQQEVVPEEETTTDAPVQSESSETKPAEEQDEMIKLADEFNTLFGEDAEEVKEEVKEEEKCPVVIEEKTEEKTEEDEMTKLADELAKALFEERKEEEEIKEPVATVPEVPEIKEEEDEMTKLAGELSALFDAEEEVEIIPDAEPVVKKSAEEEEEEEEEEHQEHEEEEEEEEDPGLASFTSKVVYDDECTQQVSKSLHGVYNFGIDALELDAANIKLDYENLEVITDKINLACKKNFSLNKNSKVAATSAQTCENVLDDISRVILWFTESDAKDNIVVAQAIQQIWDNHSKFVKSCLPAEEQEEEMSTDCLLSYVETVAVLYETSDNLKEYKYENVMDNIKKLEGKLHDMNLSCDAKYQVELETPKAFTNAFTVGSCIDDQMLLNYALQVFTEKNIGDVEVIKQSLGKIWAIATQFEKDCQEQGFY